MGRPSFRDKLVASGMRTVHRRGFATTGLREITTTAGVAQGSFTNHFASKDEFGVAVLDHYFDEIRAVIALTLEDKALSPLKCIRAYFETITGLLEEGDWRFGCLIGNMALEAAEHSESLRQRIGDLFAEWTPPFARVIREGQSAGQIPAGLDADEVGAAVLEAWHGAMLRMKADRSSAALDRFKRLTLPALLGTAANA